MSGSYTKSETNTYTEARAKYVLGKLEQDFQSIHNRDFDHITWDTLKVWLEDVSFVVHQKALTRCQIKFEWPDSPGAAVDYHMVTDGSIQIDGDASGLDFYRVPKHAKVRITIRRDPNNQTVTDYLAQRGWGKGSFLEGEFTDQGGYSKDGYGANMSSFNL